MAYVAPTWVNGGPPALDAAALNAISQALAKLPMENGGTFATSGAAGLYNLINAAATLTSGTLASGDYVGIKDVSAGTGKQVTLSNLASWIGSNGTGAKIATGSYTGTGTYGASNPNSITFPFTPKMFIVINEGIPTSYFHTGIWCIGSTHLMPNDGYAYNTVTPSGNTLRWYGDNIDYQFNANGYKYPWIAFG